MCLPTTRGSWKECGEISPLDDLPHGYPVGLVCNHWADGVAKEAW